MAAIPNRYVTVTGAGIGDGLSWATAWTLAQAIADTTVHLLIEVEGGVYPVGATLTNTVSARNWRAWDSTHSAVATSWGDTVNIDFATLGAGNGWNFGSRQSWYGFRFLNAPSWALFTTASDDCLLVFCDFQDCLFAGSFDDRTTTIFCRVDEAQIGFYGDSYFRSLFNEITLTIDNGDGIEGTIYPTAIGNYIKSLSGANGMNFNGSQFAAVINTIVGALSGIESLPTVQQPSVAAANIITDSTNGIKMSGADGAIATMLNDIFNCTNDLVGNPDFQEIGPGSNVDVDPDFTSSSDYNIGEASIQGAAPPTPFLQELNLGAAQARGGGAGGGMIVHPGMSGGLRG